MSTSPPTKYISLRELEDECNKHDSDCGVAIWMDLGCICKCEKAS